MHRGHFGNLGRYHVLVLPEGLHVLTNGWVMAVAALMFAVEFFADKIPAFDLIWNAMHTFVADSFGRPAGVQGYRFPSLREQMLATIVGGLIALAAHGARLLQGGSHAFPGTLLQWSPQLNRGRMAIGLTWLATRHPYAAAAHVWWGWRSWFLILRFVLRSLKASVQGRRGADQARFPGASSLVPAQRRSPSPSGRWISDLPFDLPLAEDAAA